MKFLRCLFHIVSVIASVIASVIVMLSGSLTAAEPMTPLWIGEPTGAAQWTASSSRTLAEPPVIAKLKFACDFAQATIRLNDHLVAVVAPYCQLTVLDVGQWMQLGVNRLEVQVEKTAGPTAIALQLDIRQSSGSTLQWMSDASWNCERESQSISVTSLGHVRPELWGAGRRDIELSPLENYEQWRQALGSDSATEPAQFWTVPGFEVARLRTAAADESSWISLTQDPQGRMIISREDQGLLRMTLNESHDAVAQVEAIAVDLKECRGLAFHDGWLYANANNSKGLYRLKLNEVGTVEQMTCLREFPGSVGHGRNDLTIADGWLYSIHGDSVDYPRDNITDLTSPLRHRSGDSQREGQLLRMNLSSGQWEVVCAGLRNPYGIAMYPSGELFSFDADNEFDMGTPWYRPTRFLALGAGGDIGYRTAEGRLPPRFHDQPENLPPVLTIGRSSPTAVFCDPMLAFPEPYRNAVYLLDWTYGRILAVNLAPRGVGWRAQAELFLQGRPLNVTDVATGPDGAMYLITGGRKTQSALYRVSAKPGSDARLTAEPHEAAAKAFADRQRLKREELELIARHRNDSQLEVIFDYLADADPLLRNRARIALERMPTSRWRARVMESATDATWLYAALALAQASEPTDVPMLLQHWLEIDPKSMTLSEQFVWLRLGELFLNSNPPVVLEHTQEMESQLLRLWPTGTELRTANEGTMVGLRQRLAQLLGLLKSEALIPLVVNELLSSSLQEDRLAGLLAVRQQRSGWTTAQRRQQFTTFATAETMQGGEGLPRFIEGLRTESLATLSDQERLALQDLLEAKSIERQVAMPSRPLVRNWKLEDLHDSSQPASSQGDRVRGAQIFQDALCARCHRVGKLGTSVGPDLSFVGRRFSQRDLLQSILEPSRSVAENYRLDVILTHAGTIHTGRILVAGDYRAEKIKLQTDALRADAIVEIAKQEVAEHRQLERSPMPDNLLDTFDKSEIRDLIAYLQHPTE